jgi:DNA polymerase (family 10)
LTALRHPEVNILGHPTGRLINRRDPMEFDLDAVLMAAAELGVAVELNAHPDRLDLRDTQVMRARELGVKIAINTDAHRVDDLRLMRYGVDQARRGWLEKGDVINTLPLKKLLKALER